MAFSDGSNRKAGLATLSLVGCVGAAFGAAGACTSSNPGDTGSSSGGKGSSSSGATSLGSGGSSGGGSSSHSGSSGSGSSSGSGGSSGGGNPSGSSNSSGAGSSSGAAGSSGASDAGACVPVTGPVLINFDNYNPMADGGFNGSFGTWPQAGYIGPYPFSGGGPDGMPNGNVSLDPVAGETGGLIDGGQDWALELRATKESVYGAGLGFWMSCANASQYKGISFWARGQTPTNTMSLTLSTVDTTPVSAQPPGTCAGMTSQPLCATPLTTGACCSPTTLNIPLTMVWTNIQIPWAMFAGNAGGAAYVPTGANITGLTFGLSLAYSQVDAAPDGAGIYGPAAADLDLQVDDISFIP
jgi:hypothetical protein